MNTQTNGQTPWQGVSTTNTLKAMVVLTPLASQKIQALMAEKNLQGYGLRVYVAGMGCSGLQYGLAFENKTEEGDFVFESQGMRVYLDAQSALYLDGAIVDYIEGPHGSGFKIENPNAVSGCSSCGSAESGCCGH
ncbi:MAG: iron-sulfur cluster assembly accessory protein [Anaerolineae bacterium]|nr:iron-sulfur cluster assembly accessory protein [Anaerolineae bacterium]